MQEFFIKAGSNYPSLRMELIEDGRYDFHKAKINNALQDSDVVFSMKDIETGILKVSKAKAVIKNADTEGCEDKYVVEYDWQTRDTAKPGIYEGWFDIDFMIISGNWMDYIRVRYFTVFHVISLA